LPDHGRPSLIPSLTVVGLPQAEHRLERLVDAPLLLAAEVTGGQGSR